MQQITVYAHAKINLCLDVLNRRPDGYHTVKMIMQSLALHDTLIINRTETPGITLSALHAERHPDITWDENNLIYKAARLWFDTYSCPGGVHILVDKQIPSAAGLAGGSSDAAATIKGLNQLFETGASMEECMRLGVKIGADVPYCILLGTALSEGIGEILTPLTPAPALYCTLVKPDCDISTKYIYEHLNLETASHPDTGATVSALENGDLPALFQSLGNILEPVALSVCPEIREIEETMRSLGAQGVCMSGSGPTVFGLFTDGGKAAEAAEHFRETGYRNSSFATRFIQP